MLSARRRASRHVATLALALAVPAIAAAPAAAGTLTIANGQVKYAAAAGEYNQVEITYDSYDGEFEIEDGGAVITLGTGATGCTRAPYTNESTRTAVCSAAGWTSTYVSGNDKDDHVTFSSSIPATLKTAVLGTGDGNLDDHSNGKITVAGDEGFDDISAYGDGSDRLDGGDGDDSIYSAKGSDTVNGGLGNDNLRVYNDVESISTVHGNEGDDSLTSGDGNDKLYGDADEDQLEGGQGTDYLHGGDGDDRLDGDDTKRPLPDTLIGGTGVDTADYSNRMNAGQAVNVSIDGVANDGLSGEKDMVTTDIENLIGGWQNDVLTGNGTANDIDGSLGDDVITGAAGSDTLTGSSGKDLITGEAGEDTINGGSGNDNVDGGDGGDDIFGGPDDDDVFGGDGADKLRSEDGFDEVDAGPGADNVDTGPGNDVVSIRDDVEDQLSCGGGADLAYVDIADVTDGSCPSVRTAPGAAVSRSGSRIIYTAGPGAANTMTVTQTTATTLTFTDSIATLAFSTDDGCARGATARIVVCNVSVPVYAITMDGNSGNDTMSNTARIGTRFYGGPGDDKIADSPAADMMFGSDGIDTFTQALAASPDVISGGSGADTVTYASRTVPVAVNLDSLRNDGADANADASGEEGDFVRTDVENVTGGKGADWLRGSDVGNTLRGGTGADSLSGGLGKDTLFGDAGIDIVNSRDGNPDAINCGTEGGRLTADPIVAGGDTQTGCTVLP